MSGLDLKKHVQDELAESFMEQAMPIIKKILPFLFKKVSDSNEILSDDDIFIMTKVKGELICIKGKKSDFELSHKEGAKVDKYNVKELVEDLLKKYEIEFKG